MIRKSLRRAQKMVKVYAANFSAQVAQVINLRHQDSYVQYVLTSPEFADARIILCRLHNTKEKDFRLIEEIARALLTGLNSRLDRGRRR
jgi:hypothetical protein